MPPAAATDLPTPDVEPAADDARRVVLAAVVGAHGIAGEVRLKVFAEDLDAHRVLNGGALTVKSVRPGNNGAIVRFAEVSSRDAAEAMRGTQLWVSRDSLPPLEDGEYYHADLIGLAAVSDAEEALGTVVAVENFGAGDVIEIERPTGKRFMVPMRAEAVPEWNGERVVVASAFIEA